jgi:hypothetical protein
MGFVEEKIGKNTTRKIGRNISRFTEIHTKVTSITDMFETINSFNRGLIEGFLLQFQIPYMLEVSEKENLIYVINPLKNN